MMPERQILFWIAFGAIVGVMLILDLGVFHRKVHVIKMKEALVWSFIWVVVALLFNAGIYAVYGFDQALKFLTSYIVERSLSMDNMFVFLLIFSYFRIPAFYQHKVLFWGILGALVIRAVFIVLGLKLIALFHWIIYIFGIVLMISGIRLVFEKTKEIHPEHNPVIKLFKRCMPVTHELNEGRFFVKKDGRSFATPLFVALLVVETTDVIFAVDSVPAVLAITNDPFIVYTSNVFAILGLRALYFALVNMMETFHYLHYGLAFILVFIGAKMLLSEIYTIPIGIALGVIVAVVLISMMASLLRLRKLGVRSFSLVLFFVLSSASLGLAAEADFPSTQKQKIVNRQTFINDATDFFATLGRSGSEKAQIIKERKETRRIERLQDLQRRKSPEVRRYEKQRRRINRELKAGG